jgi:hypothetical protein
VTEGLMLNFLSVTLSHLCANCWMRGTKPLPDRGVPINPRPGRSKAERRDLRWINSNRRSNGHNWVPLGAGGNGLYPGSLRLAFAQFIPMTIGGREEGVCGQANNSQNRTVVALDR